MTMKYPTLIIALLLLTPLSPCAQESEDSVLAIEVDEILADAAAIEGRRYVSTGQPSEDVLRVAKEAGFATVIDMRTAEEDRGIDEASVVESLGMSYVAFPVSGRTDITLAKAQEFQSLLASIDGPVFMHCRSGNRVGAMFALQEGLEGATTDDAVIAGKAAGLGSLEPRVREALDGRK